MRRRRCLTVLGTAAAVAGCLRAPARGIENGRPGSDQVGSGGADDNSSDDDVYENEDIGRYRHERGEWFELVDEGMALMVDGVERVDPENFDASGRDVFIVNMRVENLVDERNRLRNADFWLEKLGRDHEPDVPLSEQLEFGATGTTTRLDPGESRRIRLAFRVPDDVEPAYLWIEKHYVCLVP